MAFDVDNIEPNTLILDSRENKKRIKSVEYLARKNGINTIVGALTTGDYCSKSTVTEIKCGADLVTSMLSGRLMRQMERLAEMNQPLKTLLITGQLINKKYTKVKFSVIVGLMASIAARGINVIRIEKSMEALMIIKLFEKGEKYKGVYNV
jgi:ERCC4-type nuclease